jgi:mannose-6-phosphate isomerase
MSDGSKPQRIEPEFHNKVWGSPRIEPWFASRGDQLTGEVWFPAGDLLIKFLFTSQNLSVQVHPDDSYAKTHENSCGKTEMWHILRADEGARIALGFRRPIRPDELISSAQSGEIMELLNWVDVHPGETYFIPAGTVHAIGAGIALCEIQQNSDITYRLYDYGRDRPLHLTQAAAVADLGLYEVRTAPHENGGTRPLAECPYFRTDLVLAEQRQVHTGGRFLILLEGSGRVNGLAVAPGQVLRAGDSREWVIEPDPFGSIKILLTG